MGKVKKGQVCSINGCSNLAVRSLSVNYADALLKAGLNVNKGASRLYLCEEHYKSLKKVRKRESMLERWRLSGYP